MLVKVIERESGNEPARTLQVNPDIEQTSFREPNAILPDQSASMKQGIKHTHWQGFAYFPALEAASICTVSQRNIAPCHTYQWNAFFSWYKANRR